MDQHDPTPQRDTLTCPDSLPEVQALAFALLARGVADRRHAFHTPTIATITAHGAPSLRTMVLRAWNPTTRVLRVHTDIRSTKIAEFATTPTVAVHAYDPRAAVQLRLAGLATVHTNDATAEAAWSQSQINSRRCYSAEAAPGTELPEPLPAPTDPETGRANFAAINIHIESLEWLWLRAGGHRRALFSWSTSGEHATWLAP
jgi:hypothetical protein